MARLGRLALGLFCVAALALPFVASGYHLFQFSQVLIYAIALLGLNLLTGYNGQISLGHGAFFAIGGYTAAILIDQVGVPYWATIPIAGARLFRRRLPVRPAGAAARRALSRAGDLRAGGGDAADSSTSRASTPRPAASQGLLLASRMRPSACRSTPTSGSISSVSPARRRAVLGGGQSRAAAASGARIVAIRDHPIAAETMGVNTALYKAMCFGVSALYAGVAGALGAMLVGFVSPDSFGLFLSLSFLVGIVVGGLASIWGVLFGALFIEFVPNYADQLSDLFGESAKALPGAIYGVLLIVLMYVMPTGVAGALAAAPGSGAAFSAAERD